MQNHLKISWVFIFGKSNNCLLRGCEDNVGAGVVLEFMELVLD